MGALRALSQTEIMFESPIPENYCCLMRNGCESQAEALIERGRGRSPSGVKDIERTILRRSGGLRLNVIFDRESGRSRTHPDKLSERHGPCCPALSWMDSSRVAGFTCGTFPWE
jgi:hypothetical protein